MSGFAYLPFLALPVVGFAYLPFVALPVVCIVAEISWRLIEAPLIDFAKRKFARARGTHALASPAGQVTLRPEETGGATTRAARTARPVQQHP